MADIGLLTETASQYYAGEQTQIYNGGVTNIVDWTGDVILVATVSGTSNTNYAVYINNVLQIENTDYSLTANNQVTVSAALVNGDVIKIRILAPALWNNYGSYEYTPLTEVINNFMMTYTGAGKLIPHVKRTDVIFHAKRGMQELSFDTLKSIKSQELTIPESLSVVIPQDYVNYVRMSWVADLGVKHIIYPTTLTSNPYTVPVQDALGVPTQDSLGDNLEGTSLTNERWDNASDYKISGAYTNQMYNAGVYNWTWEKVVYGERYGLNPSTSQRNGWFTIDEREGKFSFSSNLKDLLIILEYVSDGLSIDLDMKIPKMAEEAIYMHIMYNLVAGRLGIPEHIVQRYKKDRRAAIRNAKIRLSNIKLDQFVQVMRNKSKWIKH